MAAAQSPRRARDAVTCRRGIDAHSPSGAALGGGSALRGRRGSQPGPVRRRRRTRPKSTSLTHPVHRAQAPQTGL